VEAAKGDALPCLIEEDDLRGDLQAHTDASDGVATIEAMAEGARKRGYRYLALTDHSKAVTMAGGLNDDQTRKHADRIREVDRSYERFWLLAGIEVDILKDGTLDLEEKTLQQLDWVVASIHYHLALSEKKMTDRLLAAIRSGVIHCIGHPTSRILGKRDPIRFDLDRILEACREHDVRLEINAQPDRLDLSDIHCKRAREAGVGFAISTDAHKLSDFAFLGLGVNAARRGWVTRDDVLNTRTIRQLRTELKRT
jgi:DNA polymerase (family 10)